MGPLIDVLQGPQGTANTQSMGSFQRPERHNPWWMRHINQERELSFQLVELSDASDAQH